MPHDTAAVSMTTFIDFVAKSGTPKATVVRNWKYRQDYHPSIDYYKNLRDSITEFHTAGNDAAALNLAAQSAPAAKRANYQLLATQYQQWATRTGGAWAGPPPTAVWRFNDVAVRVNPEVALKVGNDHLYVKLFLKAGGLKRSQASLLLELMTGTLVRTKKNISCVVLDVRNGKEFSAKGSVPALQAQLKAEAAYWATMWGLI